MSNFPRSAYDKVGGIVFFARTLDKIRLHAAGTLPKDYHKNLGSGFDGRCCRFLGVDYPSLVQRVLHGGSDEEVLDWCLARGRRHSEEEIHIWNAYMAKRGWRDEEGESVRRLESYKAEGGLAGRDDILTYFDFYDVDEGRRT
jgi:hypothetical protein